MRVIDSRNLNVREDISIHEDNGPGRRIAYRGSTCFCDEADDMTRAGRFAIEAGKLHGKSVAWIGGGFCLGPRVFAIAECVQTVYEIEPALEEFCPEGVKFIPGDWHDTISGQYDIIVYDLGGEPPTTELTKHLKSSGILI